jgi:hypothetical protein
VTRSRLDPLVRFRTHVNLDGPLPERHPELGPCHLWTASTFDSGYGQYKVDGRNVRAHRWLWRQLVGELADDEVLDHYACDRPSCVNLDHLAPTDQAGNVLRSSITLASINAAKDRCPRDHPLSGENLRRTRQGWRVCRQCVRDRDREAKRRLRLAGR